MMLLCLLTIGLTAWSGKAVADPVIFLDGRTVLASTTIHDDSGRIFEDRQQPLPGDFAEASVSSPEGFSASAVSRLTSSISDPRHLFGTGITDASATVPSTSQSGLTEAASTSFYSVFFLLDAVHSFDFSGTFTGTGSNSNPDTFSSRSWFALLRSVTTSTTIFDRGRTLSSGTNQVRRSGLLMPGEYEFTVEQNLLNDLHKPASVTSHGEFSFLFDLTPTPEPASLVLLCTGVAGLAGARGRRGSKSA